MSRAVHVGVTASRIIVAGATTAITRRTSFRKAFLAPWSPLVRDIWCYSLAAAQEQTGVAIHHGVLVLNHHHLSVTPSYDNLPVFVGALHHEMSCALNALLAKERYDSPRELWDGRDPHYMRLLDAPAQASHLIYEHLNCVAAGLVERPEHMPDHVFDFGLWKTGFIDVKKPCVFFGDARPDTLRLELTPPPLLYESFGGDLDALVHQMRRLSEDALRALRSARTRPVKGARAARRLHPWGEPRTLRESGGQPVPTFRVGARGIVGQRMNIDAANETRDYLRTQKEALVARRNGDLEHAFPLGTYAMRVRHGVPLEGEPIGQLVTRPGPLLCDVRGRLESDAARRAQLRGSARELERDVRAAFDEEARDILNHTELDVSDTTASVAPSARSGTSRETTDAAGEIAKNRTARAADDSSQVRHRFDRTADDPRAARVVVLRDRRRGRPASRRGGDPPA